jgi:hypothetical protein
MRVLAAKVDLKSALSITKDEAALSTMLHMAPNLPCEHRSEAIFQVVTEETNCSPTRHVSSSIVPSSLLLEHAKMGLSSMAHTLEQSHNQLDGLQVHQT